MGTLIAVDGGNSKTEVLVCDTGGAVLGHALGPGTNHQTVGGVAEAMARLDRLIAEARAGLPGDDPPDVVVCCLAGADLPVELATLTDAVASANWATKSVLDNDTVALLRAGTDARDAVAVVCGEGINCVGRAADGRTVRFPALGPISGDWGGGGDIGRLALWHAVRAEDGRGPDTALRFAVAVHFGLATATDVAIAAHLDRAVAARVGELAPVVFREAAGGDRVARSIVVRQGEEVAAFAAAALRRLDLAASPADVVLGGGVLRGRDPLLFSVIRDGLAATAPHTRIRVVTAPPVVGAALLGLDALGAPPQAAAALRRWSRP
ncbi:N-acetylglucosamine kinase [Actinokineospora fastidiosa]|uniref:N-acetylglucosamine kinase n=1 Tax=Actinokineospora fastidiosa TaxID=1816 RepID=A0A918LHN1_9PSEU|nr:BadF/BadG/BcrA/BcrD ATPase family protein [Actinokineospora fastidiosa]GGS49081.1 N-acetylglucosamine kinase [Actinokineospora fastidiosa]